MSVVLATAGMDHKIRFWQAPSGICSRTLRYPDSQVNCLEISPDKRYLAAGGNPHIRIFEIDTTNDSCIVTCEGHTGSVTQVGFPAHGKWMYSSSEDGTVKIYDLRSRPQHPQMSFDCGAATGTRVTSVCLCPNQMNLVSGDSNGCVKVFDLATSKCINSVVPDKPEKQRFKSPIQNVDVSSDGSTLVATSSRGTVYVWDPSNASNFKPLVKFQAHSKLSYLLKARISPDCQTLVTTSSDTTVKLWNTKTWKCTDELRSHTKWVWDAVFSDDSLYLVTASSDFSARLWDLKKGTVVRRYESESQMAVTCVALNDSST